MVVGGGVGRSNSVSKGSLVGLWVVVVDGQGRFLP